MKLRWDPARKVWVDDRPWPSYVLLHCNGCNAERTFSKYVGYDAYQCIVDDYLVNVTFEWVSRFPVVDVDGVLIGEDGKAMSVAAGDLAFIKAQVDKGVSRQEAINRLFERNKP